MISEREIWACAQQQIKRHGGRAVEVIADRVAELACLGDAEGIATWSAIAERVDQLTDLRGDGRARH